MRIEEQREPIYMIDRDGRLVPTEQLFPPLQTREQRLKDDIVTAIYVISSLIAAACLPAVILVIGAAIID